MTILIVYIIVVFLALGAMLWGQWLIFQKAGKPGFLSFIPVVRELEFLEIVNKPWWWIFPLLLTYSGVLGHLLSNSVASGLEEYKIVFTVLQLLGALAWLFVMVDLAKAYGIKGSFVYGLGLFILPFVFYPVLGLTHEYQITTDEKNKMTTRQSLILNICLTVLAGFLAFKLYLVVMEPINFARLERRHMCAVTERLEQVREAEAAYKTQFGEYTGDFNTLIAFVDTGTVTIYERKDSTFVYYDNRFQQEMNRDTTVVRIIGYQKVRERFPDGFDPQSLRYVPMTDNATFNLAAGKIDRGGITVAVFEVSVTDIVMLDKLNERFDPYIKKDHSYQIGSLTEATTSGNYENTKCKGGTN